MLYKLFVHVTQSPSSPNPQQTPRVGDGGTTGGAWCSSSPGLKDGLPCGGKRVGTGVVNGPFKCLKAHASREAMGMINDFFLAHFGLVFPSFLLAESLEFK